MDGELPRRLHVLLRHGPVLEHVGNGMYGAVIVDPAAGFAPARSHDAGAAGHALSVWLASELGQAYIAGSLGNGRYIVIMPEAGADAARTAITRLRHAGYATAVGYACFPHDGTTHDELYKSAAGQLPISLRHVA